MQNKYYIVKNVTITSKQIIIEINGVEKKWDLADISKLLLNASDVEKSTFEISPSGYGIYWPLIDEDLSIDGLLGISHEPFQENINAVY